MTPERHAQIKRIFLEALEYPRAERDAFVESACGKDAALRAEVDELLAAHDEPESRESRELLEARRGSAAVRDLAPASLVAGRYRIIDQLGRGGMGVVYRAHDELLGTVVALKFPLASGARGTSDLLREVRLAREITYPTVCRVFDVGLVDDEPFFTMEYVDGEDLASQVRRFGRLSPDRVLGIAWQVATGLAAAHAKGILHRDLKPANVLVDSRGQVRVTDFGIAVGVEQASRAARAGTPGYMAPEQLIPGREITERTDIYAWGLLVWELLTGRPRFEPGEPDDLVDAQLQTPPEAPSRFVADVPAPLDRAVWKAMSPNPAERPSSVLELLAMLGEHNALDVARSVGLTPSPEFVARSAALGTMSWPRALAWVGATVAGLTLLAWVVGLRGEVMDPDLRRAPEVLEERAIELMDRLGYPQPDVGAATDFGYLPDPTLVERRGQILFWYTRDLDPDRSGFIGDVLDGSAQLGGLDPAGSRLSQLRILLTPDGRLVHFQTDVVREGARGAGDGGLLVNRTQLEELCDLGPLSESGPMPDPPPVFADRTVRWVAADGGSVVDAAFYGGRPVYIAAHRNPGHGPMLARRLDRLRRLDALGVAVLLVLLVSIPLAWRNIQRGRADRIGAFRVTAFVFACSLAGLLLGSGHVRHPLLPEDHASLMNVVGLVVGTAGVWISYVGLEPTVRRHWPGTLVEWAQVLHGRMLDPRVGRALLVGTAFGVAWAAVIRTDAWLWSERVQDAIVPAEGYLLNAALDSRQILATIFNELRIGVYQTLFTLLILVLVRYVLRRPLPAVGVFVLLLSTVYWAAGNRSPASFLTMGLPLASTGAFLLLRFGLITHAVATMVMKLLQIYVFDLDLDAWYGAGLEVTLLLIVLFMAGGLWLARRDAAVRA